MDWRVKLVTNKNQIKDVVVEDYVYPSDAKDAALAQTDGKYVISVTPCSSKYSAFNVTPSYEQRSSELNYSDDDTDLNVPDWLFDLVIAVLVFAFFGILLWFIHPVLTFMLGGFVTWVYINLVK